MLVLPKTKRREDHELHNEMVERIRTNTLAFWEKSGKERQKMFDDENIKKVLKEMGVSTDLQSKIVEADPVGGGNAKKLLDKLTEVLPKSNVSFPACADGNDMSPFPACWDYVDLTDVPRVDMTAPSVTINEESNPEPSSKTANSDDSSDDDSDSSTESEESCPDNPSAELAEKVSQKQATGQSKSRSFGLAAFALMCLLILIQRSRFSSRGGGGTACRFPLGIP